MTQKTMVFIPANSPGCCLSTFQRLAYAGEEYFGEPGALFQFLHRSLFPHCHTGGKRALSQPGGDRRGLHRPVGGPSINALAQGKFVKWGPES